MTIELENALEHHVPTLLNMMEEFYAIDGYNFDKQTKKANLKTFVSNPHLGVLWVITNNHKIIGYIVLAFGFSFEYGGRDAFIDELFLKAQYRGKGIGKVVIQKLEENAIKLGVKAIHLEVENHNQNAFHLYTRQGYTGKNRKLLTKIPKSN